MYCLKSKTRPGKKLGGFNAIVDLKNKSFDVVNATKGPRFECL